MSIMGWCCTDSDGMMPRDKEPLVVGKTNYYGGSRVALFCALQASMRISGALLTIPFDRTPRLLWRVKCDGDIGGDPHSRTLYQFTCTNREAVQVENIEDELKVLYEEYKARADEMFNSQESPIEFQDMFPLDVYFPSLATKFNAHVAYYRGLGRLYEVGVADDAGHIFDLNRAIYWLRAHEELEAKKQWTRELEWQIIREENEVLESKMKRFEELFDTTKDE